MDTSIVRPYRQIRKWAIPPAERIALVEGPTPLSAGRALDLGCGTGTGPIELSPTANTRPLSSPLKIAG
jgi:hypothetical protein